MGLKSLFGGKKLIDRVIKCFNEMNINLKNEDNKYSFELMLKDSGYVLYPYFQLNEDSGELSMVINVRKSDYPLAKEEYERINSFNTTSKYFNARASNTNVIYLEYNCIINADNMKEVLINCINSIFSLQEEIDSL